MNGGILALEGRARPALFCAQHRYFSVIKKNGMSRNFGLALTRLLS